MLGHRVRFLQKAHLREKKNLSVTEVVTTLLVFFLAITFRDFNSESSRLHASSSPSLSHYFYLITGRDISMSFSILAKTSVFFSQT